MVSDACSAPWLVGTHRGLYAGAPGAAWELQGGYTTRVTSLLRQPSRTVVGGGSGVWEIRGGDDWWVQLHDETLTEIRWVAPIPGDPGLVVASAYGVATGRRDQLGSVRWTWHSDALAVNDRFSSAIAVEGQTWVVGTEEGVLVTEAAGSTWSAADLRGTPVRAISRIRGTLWAGTDRRGVWRSENGRQWHQVGSGLEGIPIFSLGATASELLCGTEQGVYIGDGVGDWRPVGPDLRIAAVGAHPQNADTWLAGADPGGVWLTEDGGRTWRQLDGFPERVDVIAPPERRA